MTNLWSGRFDTAPDAAAKLSSASTTYEGLLTIRNNLEFANSEAPQVVTRGAPVRRAATPKVLFLAVGLVLGSAIGLLVALIRGQMSKVVLDRGQLADLLGTGPIGTIDLRPRRFWRRGDRTRSNAELYGEIVALARANAKSWPTRVAVAGVDDERGPRNVLFGLLGTARTVGATASIASPDGHERLAMLERSASFVGDHRASITFVDASRLFERPLLAQACRESDVVVVVVEIAKDRSAPLAQLGRVLRGGDASIIPLLVRTRASVKRTASPALKPRMESGSTSGPTTLVSNGMAAISGRVSEPSGTVSNA